MLKIRLQRTGRKRAYSYRLVVAEKNDPTKGKFIERLGQYDPAKKEKSLDFDKDRVKYWVSVGARPSETTARLLAKNGVEKMEMFFKKHEHKKRKKKAPEEEAALEVEVKDSSTGEAEKPSEETKEEVKKEEVKETKKDEKVEKSEDKKVESKAKKEVKEEKKEDRAEKEEKKA